MGTAAAGPPGRACDHERVLAGNPLATRTSGRCGCTRRQATTTTRRGAIPPSTSSRGSRARSTCGATATRCARSSPRSVDELFSDGETPQCLVVFVDCWTSLGGSQFVDSPATGRYHTYLCDEVVAWVDARYRTLAAAAHRGIAGKSSGGYGAMITPMLRPDLWGGLATHAGDALFEACYARDFAPCARLLRDNYGGSIDRFLADFRSRLAFTRDGRRHAAEHLRDGRLLLGRRRRHACGCRSIPPPAALMPEVWERWLAWDPVRMVPGHADALRSMRAIYIDAGTRRRVLSRPGRRGVPFGARRDRRHRCPLRALRRHPHEHRLPLSDRAALPGRAARRIAAGPPPLTWRDGGPHDLRG